MSFSKDRPFEMRNINRVEAKSAKEHWMPTQGWQVRIARHGKKISKLFSDNVYGSSEKALEAAKQFRDKKEQEVPIIRGFHTKPSRRNTSGIVGVRRTTIVNKKRGNIYTYDAWEADWVDSSGRLRRTSFSVNKNGELGALKRAIKAREQGIAEALGISIQDQDEFLNRLSLQKIGEIDEPIRKLKKLLEAKDNTEAKYQKLFCDYPWVFGARYRLIQRHQKLDDRNIPDFTGVRVHDGCSDIFEIKPPFTKFFRDDGELSADFNDAWYQAERYLDFVRRNQDYLLREKDLTFDHPKCFLILGYNLTKKQKNSVNVKQRNTYAIEFLSYNDLLAIMEATVELVKSLKY